MGFTISNNEGIVYGSIHSNETDDDIYQGISKTIYEFNNLNGEKRFIIIVDRKENHLWVIPFDIMKNEFFQRKSGDRIHYDFNILRNPYMLQKKQDYE